MGQLQDLKKAFNECIELCDGTISKDVAESIKSTYLKTEKTKKEKAKEMAEQKAANENLKTKLDASDKTISSLEEAKTSLQL